VPETREIDLGYWPRPWQDEAHANRRRWTVLVWHRRAGKTEWALIELLHSAIELTHAGVERPRLAYLAPLYRQAKATAWDRLKAYALMIPGAEHNEQELRVDLPGGARVQLFGADHYDSLRGGYFDGVVLDEVAQMSPRAFTEVIRPALADRNGWAVWIGTPKGRNAFWDVYDKTRRAMDDGDRDFYAEMRPVSQTGALPEPELEDARRQMSPEEYDQEFECSFQAAVVGAYYGKEMAQADAEGRITRVPYDPGKPCVTAWDLGIGDDTVIWIAQQVGYELRVIDLIAGSSVGLDWYARELASKPYAYSEHLLPHDAAARELGTGKTREETLKGLGLGRTRILPAQSVEDGINAVRRLLPSMVFDAHRCERGVEALRLYRRAWDEKGQVFRPRPLHDHTSHFADALRYLAMGLKRPETQADTPVNARRSVMERSTRANRLGWVR
jgi:phage terminase large subunit